MSDVQSSKKFYNSPSQNITRRAETATPSSAQAQSLDAGPGVKGIYDPNLFLDCQFINHHLNWVLCTGDTIGATNYKLVLLRGIANDASIDFSGQHEFDKGDVLGISDLARQGVEVINQISQSGKLNYNFWDNAVRNSGLDNTQDGIKGLINKNIDTFGSGWFADLAKKGANKIINEMGGHYITAFDHVKVFKGTNLEINFPPLTTRIYHNQWRGMSVLKVLDSLFERFIGDMTNPMGDDETSLTSVFGVQRPPNGYQPAFNQLSVDPDTIIPGTFRLNYSGYEINNLLVTNFGFKLSTMRVREAPGGWDGLPNTLIDTSSPLYVDVSITVQPCTFVSKSVLADIIASKYMEDSKDDRYNLSEF